MYYPPEIQVTPLTHVRRERVLPLPGEVLVCVGEHVEPTQVIARANMPSNFCILPVARALDIPADKIKRYMRVNINDSVQRGKVIASRRGLGARSVKSPIDGIVSASGGGRVLIEAEPAPFELRAYIPGAVSSIQEDQVVIIETTGAVLQGAWGASGEGFGVLKCMVKSPDQPLKVRDIDPSCHGTILIGGPDLGEAIVERAREIQVRGIIVGGIPAEMMPKLQQLPFPVVATEGIGAIPMSKPVFRLLQTNDGREASISGQFRRRWGIVRPEIVVPLPAETVPPAEGQPGAPLTIGAHVRAVRAPYTGQVGTVRKLPPAERRIETGDKVLGAEVDLGQETPAFIPLANLEVVR